MSYYASGNGDLVVKESADIKHVENIIIDAFEVYDRDGRHFCISHEYGPYYSDSIDETLNMLKDSLEEGEICFSGEDGQNWRKRLAGNEWVEDDGEPVYDNQTVYVVALVGKTSRVFLSEAKANEFYYDLKNDPRRKETDTLIMLACPFSTS